jgi:hypothetical protein
VTRNEVVLQMWLLGVTICASNVSDTVAVLAAGLCVVNIAVLIFYGNAKDPAPSTAQDTNE